MNCNLSIKAENLGKKFGKKKLFSGIDFKLEPGSSLAITGANGSGKSTLMKIAAGLASPDSGSVIYESDGTLIDESSIYRYIGYSSPEINLYGELTCIENAGFSCSSKKSSVNIPGLIEKLGLTNDSSKQVKFFSSGMKQRLKIICSLVNDPPVVFFDEPGTNLDAEGKDAVYSIIKKISETKIVIIATNEQYESSLCSNQIKLTK